jgi:hypothetical protein
MARTSQSQRKCEATADTCLYLSYQGLFSSPSLITRTFKSQCPGSKPVVICFLLGNSRASEFYMRMFHNTLKMEQTECSEALAYKIQTPGNYPEESIRHSEHVESLKSKINIIITITTTICKICMYMMLQ